MQWYWRAVPRDVYKRQVSAHAGMEIAEIKVIAYFCILSHFMAKQELITKLSSFFEQQTKDDAQIEDESTFAEMCIRARC